MDRGYSNYLYYIADGYSGTNFNRPDFQRMIADVEAGKIDIHFIAVNDGVDSTQGDNEFTPFRNIINEWYAKDTSKKIRAVKKAKGMAGEHIGSHAPYGYRKNPDNLKEWLVDDEAAAVVREIFSLCVGGYGPTQIANILTERKILCPTMYAVSKGLKQPSVVPEIPYQWNAPAVSKILERMEYLGHTVNFKTHVLWFALLCGLR